MKISVSKADVFWGYFSQIFIFSSGLITLPLVLMYLTPDEIGLNFIMLTLGSLVMLLDFGFTPQFSRNITYVFSGAQNIKKVGISSESSKNINFKLLSNIIHTAKFIYLRLSVFIFLLLLSFGTYYIYFITNGFNKVDNSLAIWLLFSTGIFFSVYYSYYTSLLLGKGLVKESRKAMVYSKILYISLTFLLLFFGFGLKGVVLAQVIAPFISRYVSYKFFFTDELKSKIKPHTTSDFDKMNLIKIVWYNSRKLGLVFVGSFAVNKTSMFLSGIFLSLNDIASFGLMIQMFTVIYAISGIPISVSEPRFASLRTKLSNKRLIREFAFCMNIYYVTYIIGTLFVLYIVPYLLSLIGSSVSLPNFNILLIYAIVVFLEGNHSFFSTLIVTKNEVPFVTPSLISGFFITIGCFLTLKYSNYGILGLVLVQGVVQVSYSNWKWPLYIFREFNINLNQFITLGYSEFIRMIKK